MANARSLPGSRVRRFRPPNSELRLAFLFLVPALVLVAVLMYYPMLRTVFQSLFNSSMIHPKPVFVGLGNYVDLLGDSRFWKIVLNSAVWTLTVVLFQALLGLADRGVVEPTHAGQRLDAGAGLAALGPARGSWCGVVVVHV